MEPESELAQSFLKAVRDKNPGSLRELLSSHDELLGLLDQPWFSFGKTALVESRTDRDTVEVLLEFGADPKARSEWDMGSYGVLNDNSEEMVKFFLERGVELEVHVASEHGWLDELQGMLEANPALVNRRGPDGQTPLHYAKSVEVAELLVAHGAELDARCLDHRSTPTQYAVSERPDVCRYLLSQGAWFDLPVAVVLGDLDRVKSCAADDLDSVTRRAGEGQGDINTWRLGNKHPALLACEYGHDEVLDYLCSVMTPAQQLCARCWNADRVEAQKLLERDPDLVKNLPPEQMRVLADAAWDGKLDAVQTMLELGFDINTRGDHQSTPLDRASVRGFLNIVRALLPYQPDTQVRNEFGGVPLSAACWGSVYWCDPKGDYPGVVRALLNHGARGIAEHEVDGDHGYGYLLKWMLKEGPPEVVQAFMDFGVKSD